MPRGKCHCNEGFEKSYLCIKNLWNNDVHKAFCKKEFPIKKGKQAIEQLVKSKSHSKCVSLSENHKVNNFFTRKESSEGKIISEVWMMMSELPRYFKIIYLKFLSLF